MSQRRIKRKKEPDDKPQKTSLQKSERSKKILKTDQKVKKDKMNAKIRRGQRSNLSKRETCWQKDIRREEKIKADPIKGKSFWERN